MRSNGQVQRSPHAGDLRRRVTITECADILTENGFQETAERIVATVWAAIVDDSSRMLNEADTEAVAYTTTILIRYRAGIRPGMKVTYTKTGQVWQIVAVDAFQQDRHYLSLKCQRLEEAEA